MIQQLLVLQQQQLAMATYFASATTTANLPKYPMIKFPKWDGKRASVPVFFAQLKSYKGDPFFTAVASWDITMPTTHSQKSEGLRRHAHRSHPGATHAFPEQRVICQQWDRDDDIIGRDDQPVTTT